MVKIKKLIAICAAALVLLSVIPVWGAQETPFLQQCIFEQDKINVYMSNLVDTDLVHYSITIADQPVLAQSIQTLEETGEGITWWVLVDDSASLLDSQQESVRKIILQMHSNLGENDNMMICTMSDPSSGVGLLDGSTDISQIIDNWKADQQNTYLYDSMITCLQSMENNADIHTAHCLVVLSDGENDTTGGKTIEDVQAAIGNSRIPVFSVSVLPENFSQKQMDHAESLSGLADISVGGLGFIPVEEGLSDEVTADLVMTQMRNMLVMNLNLSMVSLDSASEQAELRVVYEMDDQQYGDSMVISAENVPVAEDITDTGNTDQEETESHSVIEDPASLPLWGWIAIGVGAAILIALLVVLLLFLRKKKSEETTKQAPVPNHSPAEQAQQPISGVPSERAQQQTTEETKTAWKLNLIAIDHEEVQFHFLLKQEQQLVLGSDVMHVIDRQLSPQQCIIRTDGKRLIVKDCGTKSVTCINGIPIRIREEMFLNSGGKIRLGSCEYRAIIEEIKL